MLVAVGAYVTYYGVYELRLFLAGGSAIDPVVQGAGRFQNTLVQIVAALGRGRSRSCSRSWARGG